MLELVREIGAAAGLTAVVGLAVLAALHRSQARDVRRLREWAARAPEQTAIFASRRSQPWYGRRGARAVAVAVVGLLVVGGALSLLTGDDGDRPSGDAQAHEPDGSRDEPHGSGAAVEPGDVTVAVLNGTTVTGLAARLRDELAAAGFDTGTIDVFSDQQLTASVVHYAPGHEAAAQAVGRRLGITRSEPVTADSRAIGGDATVIVIAGADQAP